MPHVYITKRLTYNNYCRDCPQRAKSEIVGVDMQRIFCSSETCIKSSKEATL